MVDVSADPDCESMSIPTRPVSTASRAGYLAVLRLPGVAAAFLPAAAGRLAFAMVTLSVLMMVQQSTGSFALAGATTGALGLTSVVASPFRARLVDRHGQRAVLPLLALLFAVGMWALALAVGMGAPAVVVVIIAAAVGATPPPIGAAMRVIWAGATPAGALRLRAFSVDSLSEDLAFTLGPLVVSLFLVFGDPRLSTIIAPLALLVATWALTRSRLSRLHGAGYAAVQDIARPAEAVIGDSPPRALLRRPAFVAVLVVLLGQGVMLGAVEVATAAFADEHGGGALAGALLAAFAGGSAVGSLLYGMRDWRVGAQARLLALATAIIAAGALLAATGVPVVFGGLVAVVGFALGPALITGYLLADGHSDATNRTQASAWVNTAVNAGASVAAVGIGAIVDGAGTSSALAVAVGVAALCAAFAAPVLARRR